MTVKEAATRLEVSASTVYGLVAVGKLGHYRAGRGRGTIRFTEAHIAAFMAGVEPRTPAPPAPAIPRLKHLRLP